MIIRLYAGGLTKETECGTFEEMKVRYQDYCNHPSIL